MVVVSAHDTHGIVSSHRMATYDVVERDSLWLTIVGSKEGKHISLGVSPGIDASSEANLHGEYFKRRELYSSFLLQTCCNVFFTFSSIPKHPNKSFFNPINIF